jgi:S1-C subfamily serine protease
MYNTKRNTRMSKLFSVLLTTLALATSASAWELDAMNKHIDQTNFIVGSGCSGTLINIEERLILTNHHCISGAVQFRNEETVAPDGTVTTKRITDTKTVPVYQRVYSGHTLISSSQYLTDLVAWDEDLDLALLQFKQLEIPFSLQATISQEPVQRGEQAFVIGNPMGLENTVMRGVISSVNRLVKVGAREIPYLQVDAGVTGGNSGGSLYNDNGIFIGVPAAAARGTVIGLAVPAEFVINFLDEFCRSNAYDPTAPSYEECIEPTEEEEVDG